MGLVACLIAFVEFPLWMVGGISPSFSDSGAFAAFVTRTGVWWTTRTLMDLVIFILMMFLFAVIRRMIIDRRRDLEWMATLLFGISLVYASLTLIADCVNASMALDAFGARADPTVIRTMVETTLLMLDPPASS